METSRSTQEFFVVNKIKKELDESSFYDDTCENLDPQKYYYKEELDLQWDEKDNNYFDKSYATTDGISMERSKGKTIDENVNSILQNNNSQLDSQSREINVKVESPNIERENISENLPIQKYHCKEELNLDWDEKDNDYDKNNGTIVQMSIENTEIRKPRKNKKNSILKVCKSRKRKTKVENPDAEKECPRCKKRLKNQNTLMKHLFYCGKEPHLQCDSCTYKAKYKNALIVHIIRNHPQQIPNVQKKRSTQKMGNRKSKIPKEQQQSDKCFRFCKKCNVSTEKSKSNKCNNCESSLLYQCRKCTATFPSREKLTRHIIDKCDPKGYYHCPACDFKATVKQTVKFHLTIHLVPGSHLDTETIKWKNIENKSNNTENVCTCPSCGKQFQRKASLASHMRFCIKSQGVSKPPTHYVEKKISDFRNLITQYCSKCDMEVLNCSSQTSSECCGSMILFKCLKCNKTYDRISSMYYHVRYTCYPRTKYKCDLCDYEGNDNNLARHRKWKHDVISVECTKCNKRLKNKFALKKHSYYCRREPLKCDHCLYSTKRKYYLKLHIFKNHQK